MALGATKWQTIWRQVLPASVPGMSTGAIFALSRAIGETAPLHRGRRDRFRDFGQHGLFSDFSALPIQIYGWTTDPQEAYQVLAAAAIMVLMAILLSHERNRHLATKSQRTQKW